MSFSRFQILILGLINYQYIMIMISFQRRKICNVRFITIAYDYYYFLHLFSTIRRCEIIISSVCFSFYFIPSTPLLVYLLFPSITGWLLSMSRVVIAVVHEIDDDVPLHFLSVPLSLSLMSIRVTLLNATLSFSLHHRSCPCPCPRRCPRIAHSFVSAL
jgi:hypothetical protein